MHAGEKLMESVDVGESLAGASGMRWLIGLSDALCFSQPIDLFRLDDAFCGVVVAGRELLKVQACLPHIAGFGWVVGLEHRLRALPFVFVLMPELVMRCFGTQVNNNRV